MRFILFKYIATIGLLAAGLSACAQKYYYQQTQSTVVLPVTADKNIIKLFGSADDISVVCSNGIFRFQKGQWTGEPYGSGWLTAALHPSGVIWLASAKTVEEGKTHKVIVLPEFYPDDSIRHILWQDEKTLLVGTNHALYGYDGEWKTLATGMQIRGMVKDGSQALWVATDHGLLKLFKGQLVNMDENLMARGLGRQYYAVGTSNGGADVVFGGRQVVGCIAGDGAHWIARGTDGLPYGPVNCIKAVGNTLWLGTDKGVIRKDSLWHYFNGKRWLPNGQVNDILPLDELTAWVATREGISELKQVKMSLEQKAAFFEERIQKRHLRHGLVARSRLRISGDLSSNEVSHTYNDGLWTGIYLAAESFRYAATKDPQARKNAERAFEAMERLEQVTANPGFPARTVVAPQEKAGEGEWRWSADGKWKWLGGASSDEMVGHLFAYPIFYELAASTAYKQRTQALTIRILDHILKYNFQLEDLDKGPTRWGVWNPDSLNRSENWIYEKGTNSLQILSFLYGGYKISQQKRFAQSAQRLATDEHYAENMLTAKMARPFEQNFVDNQLAFLPYYILGNSARETPLWPYLQKSVHRSWKIVRADRTPIWNIIASQILQQDCDLKIAQRELEEIPMDMIMWNMENSHRWDLLVDPLTDRMGKRQGVKPVPVAERGVTKWNISPYQLDSGGFGKEENDGAYFLLAYWMGRYHNYWK